MINKGKNVKWRYKLKNKLIIFIYYLKLFFTLNVILPNILNLINDLN